MENPVIIGSVITVAILITAVYDIDSAVSPFASLVIILEVTPPGQQASIIIPTAISAGNFIIDITENVTNGRINIWLIKPNPKALGSFRTFLKSSIVNPAPNVNIIKTSDRGKNISIIILINFN